MVDEQAPKQIRNSIAYFRGRLPDIRTEMEHFKVEYRKLRAELKEGAPSKDRSKELRLRFIYVRTHIDKLRQELQSSSIGLKELRARLRELTGSTTEE